MYEGQERRKMERDWLERDRLLTEVHADMKYFLKWADEHDRSDNHRFEKANSRIGFVEKIAYCGIGGLATLEIVLKIIK